MTYPMKTNKIVIQILRIFLAALLLVFSLNGFIGFLPMPVPPESAAEFLRAMSEAGFVFPVLYGIELVLGVFLLLNYYTPFVLIAFVPIALSILLYHLFLDPLGGVAGYLTVGIGIILLWAYFDYYKPLLKVK